MQDSNVAFAPTISPITINTIADAKYTKTHFDNIPSSVRASIVASVSLGDRFVNV